MAMRYTERELRKTGDPLDKVWADQIAAIRRNRSAGDIPLPETKNADPKDTPKTSILQAGEVVNILDTQLSDLISGSERKSPPVLTVFTAKRINDIVSSLPEDVDLEELLSKPGTRYSDLPSEQSEEIFEPWDDFQSQLSKTEKSVINSAIRYTVRVVLYDLSRDPETGKVPLNLNQRVPVRMFHLRDNIFPQISAGTGRYSKRSVAFTALAFARDFDAVAGPQSNSS